MGEAKRRKKLDPNFGKNKNHVSANQDFLLFRDVLCNFDEDEDDLDDEYKDENLYPLSIKYQFEAHGKTPDNQTISDSGRGEFRKLVREYQFDDDGIIFGEVFQSVMETFYAFEFEKKGYTEVSEVTITIKNLRIDN